MTKTSNIYSSNQFYYTIIVDITKETKKETLSTTAG